MKKLVKVLGAAALAATVVAMPASAQMEAGDKSISLAGLMMVTDASSTVTAFGGFNYYQTKNFAWRLNANLSMTEVTGSDAITTTNLGAGLEWNFVGAESKSVPFIAFDINQSIMTDFSQTELAPSIGLRSFLNRNASFDTALSYRTALSQDETVGDTGGTLLLQLGLSFYFGRDARR